VFCGAKQAAAPAVQPGLAKTAFGYSANEVMQQLGNPGQPAPYQPPQQQGYQPPRAQPPSQPPPMGGPGYPPPQGGYPQGGLAPSAGAHAPTMMVQPGGGPMGPPSYTPPVPQPGPYGGGPAPYQPPGGGYGGPPPGGPMGGGGMGIHSPQVSTPQPLPAAQPPPYLASQTAARAGRPIEPWKDSLRLMMFIWGAVALVTFAIPMTTDPMTFNWDAIIHAPGKMKVIPLIWASIGLLSIALGAIPMQSMARGVLAAVLGFSGIFAPMAVMGHFGEWQQLIQLVGALCLVPGLLIRHEYVESMLARLLVTIGVICTLVPYLVPDHGQIPLVQIFKGIVEGRNHMELYITALAQIVLVVMCLLAWMPGPATAGAKIFAWAIILWPVAAFVLAFLGMSHFDTILTKEPGQVVQWAPGVVYSILVGYGAATVVGKQLE